MELEAFKTNIWPLREKMLNYARKMVDEPMDAEDIVQDAFLKLWSIRDKLDAYRSVEALAIQVTKNLSIDWLRGHKQWLSETEGMELPSETSLPDKIVEEQDAVERIRLLIGMLPPLQQTVIRMKDVEGYELDQIAGITGTHVEAVRSNLSRARKKIRELYVGIK